MDPARTDVTRTEATDELRRHLGWVHELARRLVSDAHHAEDVAQEACLALWRGGGTADSPRRFLAGVARNLANLRLRRLERRVRREEVAARGESQPSTLDALTRSSTRSLVVETVKGLPEPYREVVLLRFFEGLPPAAIARQLEVPVSTVKTRLARAQAQLRERLDRLHGGDGTSWLTAIATLVERPPRRSPVGLGAVASLTLLSVVGLGTILALVPRSADRGPAVPFVPAPGVSVVREPSSAAADVETGLPEPSAEGRRPRDTREDPEASGPELLDAGAIEPGTLLHGRVVDAEGAPVGGLLLRFAPYGGRAGGTGERILQSAADGTFALGRFGEGGTVSVLADGWRDVLVGETGGEDGASEVVVVVGRLLVAKGRVLDPLGTPLPDVRVTLVLPAGLRAGFATALGRSTERERVTTTDGLGRFELEVPRVPGASLRLERSGFARLELPLDPLPDPIVLEPARTPGRSPGGRVLDASGVPAPDVRVASDACEQVTDPDGSFDATAFAESLALAAWSPTSGSIALATRAEDEPWPSPLELRLAPAPLPVTGRIVDERGRPRRGVRVALVDSTPFAGHPGGLEALLAGHDLPWVSSNADGEFALPVASGRSYSLAALDPVTLERAEVRDVRSGTAVRVGFDPSARREVRGRLVDDRGASLSGATVTSLVHLVPAVAVRGATQRTDLDGRFVLPDVPVSDVSIELNAAGHLPDTVPLASGAVNVRVELVRGARIRVVIPEDWEMDGTETVAVLDGAGGRLPLVRFLGDRFQREDEVPLIGGRTEALGVDARAAFLVLARGGEVVRRVPLQLTAGETAVVVPRR